MSSIPFKYQGASNPGPSGSMKKIRSNNSPGKMIYSSETFRAKLREMFLEALAREIVNRVDFSDIFKKVRRQARHKKTKRVKMAAKK
jgi:hypothetical protein